MGLRADTSGKAYKYVTEHFGIPVTGEEEMTVHAEHTRWTIVENQLLAATKGVYCAVFEDGDYQVIDNVDGTYTVMLVGTGHDYAFMGMVNGGLAFTEDPIIWEGLKNTHKYYLYATYEDGMYLDPMLFGRTSRTIPIENGVRTATLLAVFDGTTGKIDNNPDGKIYGEDLSSHMGDDHNPHGTKMYQDEIIIGSLIHRKVNNDGSSTLTPMINGKDGLLDTLRQKTITVHALSGGPSGVNVDIPFPGTVVSASAQEFVQVNNAPTFGLGEVCVRVDPGAAVVTVFNAGAEGIPIIVEVIVEA